MTLSVDGTGTGWRRHAGRVMLAVAGGASLVYALQIVIDLARPDPTGDRPPIGLLGTGWPTAPKVVFWAVLTSWAVAAGIGLAVLRRHWDLDAERWTGLDRWGGPPALVAVLLLIPYLLYPAAVLVGHPWTVLACLPGTTLALFGVRRLQRFRRLPALLLAGLFGWGMLVATGLGGINNVWVGEYTVAYFQHSGDLLQILHRTRVVGAIGAGVFEEAAKAAVLLLVYLLARHRLSSVVAGITAGAVVGLGFNLTETVEYMTAMRGAGASFQYWMRQCVGLLAAHTAFTVLVGAGFAIAAGLADARLRRLTIGCALLAATGGHLGNDILMPWLGQQAQSWWHPAPTLDALLIQPALLTLLQGPFVLIYALLLRQGRRGEATALTRAVHAEAATGEGAITDAEIPILLSPSHRLWLQVTALRRYGITACRGVRRLHAAQYELAAAHVGSGPEQTLRARVARARADLATAVTATRARQAEATA